MIHVVLRKTTVAIQALSLRHIWSVPAMNNKLGLHRFPPRTGWRVEWKQCAPWSEEPWYYHSQSVSCMPGHPLACTSNYKMQPFILPTRQLRKLRFHEVRHIAKAHSAKSGTTGLRTHSYPISHLLIHFTHRPNLQEPFWQLRFPLEIP